MLPRSLGWFCLLLVPVEASAQAPAEARVDAHGFPLPEGAIVRLGDLHYAQRGNVNGIVVSPDGKTVATAGVPHRRTPRHFGDFEEPVLYLWNAEAGRIIHEIPLGVDGRHGRPIGFTSDGKLLAILNPDFQFVDVATGKQFWPNDQPERPGFVKPHFLDGDRYMVGHNHQDVEVWDVGKGTLVRRYKSTKTQTFPDWLRVEELKLEGQQIRVSLSPSGATMAWFVRTPVGQLEWPSRAEVRVFDTLTGEPKGGITKLHGYYGSAALLDEGETVLLENTFLGTDPRGTRDIGGNVAFDVKTAQERFRLHHIVEREEGHIVPSRNPIEGFRLAAVAPDGKSFHTFGTRTFHERRDMATGKVLTKLDSFASGTELIFSFAGDGKRTVVGDYARWYWGDLDLKPLTPATEAPRIFPTARYLSPSQIRFAGADGTFYVWDRREHKVVETGSQPPFPKLQPEPASLDWCHPKGRDSAHRLLVSNYRQRLVVFDRVQGRTLCQLEGILAPGLDGTNWPVVSADGTFTLVPRLDGKEFVVHSFETRTGRRLATHRTDASGVFPGYYPLFPYGQHTRPAVNYYSADGSVFGYTTRDSRLTLVDTKTGKALITLGYSTPPAEMASISTPTPAAVQGALTPGTPARIDPDPVPPTPAWIHYTTHGRTFIAARKAEYVEDAGYEYVLIDRESGAVLRRRNLPGGRYSHDGRFVFTTRNVDDVFVYETATGTLRGSIATGAGYSFTLSIAPDDKTMATGCADTSILVWDLNRPLDGGPELPPANVPGAKVADYWQLLGEAERKSAEPALWALVRGPGQTLDLMRECLQPAENPEPGLFEDPHLPPTCLRELRALEVLERIGTADAKSIVETVAGGHGGALLTREAKQVLSRWP